MTRAVLSVGANLGDRLAALRSALRAFEPWLVAASPVYETPPWGPVPQDDYLNAVLIVADPAAEARDWLARARGAEDAAGRTRDLRWGPRTLDVDVIAVDDLRSTDPELTLPHPRAAERAFVLVPWLEIEPGGWLGDRSLAQLVADLPAAEVSAVRRLEDVVLT